MDDAAKGLMLSGTALTALDVVARSFLPHAVLLAEKVVDMAGRGLDLFERAVVAGERLAAAVDRLAPPPMPPLDLPGTRYPDPPG